VGLADVNRLLASATSNQRAGREEAAAEDLRRVLQLDPNNPAALNALGMRSLLRGDPEEAVGLFGRAAAADPSAPALWMNVAKARRIMGDDEGERTSLTRVLEIDQRHLMALIRLAELHERRGEDALANRHWMGAIAVAGMIEGRSPELDALIAHGASFVAKQGAAFAQVLEVGLAPAYEGLERRDRHRFEAAVDHALGRRTIYTNACAGLHFPFLPADEFFAREHFPWMEELEKKTDVIRAELRALLEDGQEGFRPYVKMGPGTPENKWTELDNSMRWGAFFLWEYGEANEAACARCPQTAAALAAVPRAELPGRAPSAFFSLLRPKTSIPPHTGVSNTRAIIHLPLIVPDGCGFRVGGETRQWRVGEAFAFDDTIEHEAWNESDELRAVLIFDVWNPHLTETEKRLLRDFYRVADASGHNPEPREGR
jgi:aspartyl/asparaginyl beta-hydroxylase (cupin superfamily)